ncbi:MAG: hypothetical protein A2Z25_16560 [Planctomycetes bacterium RBG_16_55_9]|nr:MAG: hypothetical protein A2Z25_16560 [Planctomycetes bacterium RBG_16_55_9]
MVLVRWVTDCDSFSPIVISTGASPRPIVISTERSERRNPATKKRHAFFTAPDIHRDLDFAALHST